MVWSIHLEASSLVNNHAKGEVPYPHDYHTMGNHTGDQDISPLTHARNDQDQVRWPSRSK